MTISVIIVSYNSGPLLIDCVLGVLASTIPVEVIVSDNGSTDCSVESLIDLAVTEPRLRVLQNGRNLGFSGGNNVALPLSTGDLVLFLNPDCIVKPDVLARMRAVLDGAPEAGMAGCRIRNPDGSEEASCRRRIPTPALLLGSLMGKAVEEMVVSPAGSTPVEAISGAFMLVRRADLDRIGSFDDGYFMHWEDLDLCQRFREAGRRVLFVPDVEVIHFKGRSSSATPIRVEWYKHRGLIRFFRKFHFRKWPLFLFTPVAGAIMLRFAMRVVWRGWRPKAAPMIPPEEMTAGGSREVWVSGATSLIGRWLIPRLLVAGYRVRAFSRDPVNSDGRAETPRLSWHRLDLEFPSALPSGSPDILIHLAPIYLLPPILAVLITRKSCEVIAFSSTSALTKLDSTEEGERTLAKRLATAEGRIRHICEAAGCRWTILRPTMIYSLGHDRNITRLAKLIRRLAVFPMPGEGRGLRQPVHADDLAKACVAILQAPGAWNGTYVLSGGEVLSYRAMVERIFLKLGCTPRVIQVPEWLWRVGLAAMRVVPGYGDLNVAMIRRVDSDMCFVHEDATEAFGYHPRRFLC